MLTQHIFSYSPLSLSHPLTLSLSLILPLFALTLISTSPSSSLSLLSSLSLALALIPLLALVGHMTYGLLGPRGDAGRFAAKCGRVFLAGGMGRPRHGKLRTDKQTEKKEKQKNRSGPFRSHNGRDAMGQ